MGVRCDYEGISCKKGLKDAKKWDLPFVRWQANLVRAQTQAAVLQHKGRNSPPHMLLFVPCPPESCLPAQTFHPAVRCLLHMSVESKRVCNAEQVSHACRENQAHYTPAADLPAKEDIQVAHAAHEQRHEDGSTSRPGELERGERGTVCTQVTQSTNYKHGQKQSNTRYR
jgi:hypothetical protein